MVENLGAMVGNGRTRPQEGVGAPGPVGTVEPSRGPDQNIWVKQRCSIRPSTSDA